MNEGVDRCKKCDGFGAYQDYIGGAVSRVYCDCKAGERFKERIEEGSEEMTAANSFIEEHKSSLQERAESEK